MSLEVHSHADSPTILRLQIGAEVASLELGLEERQGLCGLLAAPTRLPAENESPARRVMRLFGAARCGALTELTTDALRKWDRPLSKGGGGGLVPAKYQQLFLDEAARVGVPLRPDELIAAPIHIRAREDVQ